MKAKTIGILVASLVYLFAAFFAAKYSAGYVYFLVNKRSPDAVTIDTWQEYWAFYAEDPVQKKKLKMSAALAGLVFYFIPLLVVMSLGRKERSLHGDARFASAEEIRKSGLMSETGIIVGKYGSQYLMYPGQEFVLLAAPTRSGKGVSAVLTNLLNYPDSVVALDVKLENYKLTSGFRAKHGQEVYLFNPFAEDGKTHRWNPLDGVSRDPNFRVGDVLAIAQTLYPTEGKQDSFWNEQAANLFLGLALYLLETPDLPCTFGELLRQSSGKGKTLKDHINTIIATRSNCAEGQLSGACLDALARFCATSENTMSSIIASFNSPLTIFSNPIVDAATAASDFDVADVRKRRMSIYIGIQPNRLASAALLINLFFSQLINLNTVQLPQDNKALKFQCLLILDEFTALGKIGILAKAVSFIAGYNLRLLPIIQSVAQLESVYGEKDTRTFVTNHAVQIIFPPREQKDANEYSEMLGYLTQKATSTGISRNRAGALGQGGGSTSENVSDQRRALMLPQELKELGQDKEIILKENTKPILCEKVRYYSDPAFVSRLKSVSPTLASSKNAIPTREELELAAFVNHELASLVPSLDIGMHIAKIEQRTRGLQDDEAVDLAKLVVNLEGLPSLDDPDNPSPESVTNLVDAFFASIEWLEPTLA